jgi:hypothetical protein
MRSPLTLVRGYVEQVLRRDTSVSAQTSCNAGSSTRVYRYRTPWNGSYRLNVNNCVGSVNRPGMSGDFIRWKEDEVMGRPSQYPREMKERAIRLVVESKYASGP